MRGDGAVAEVGTDLVEIRRVCGGNNIARNEAALRVESGGRLIDVDVAEQVHTMVAVVADVEDGVGWELLLNVKAVLLRVGRGVVYLKRLENVG